MRLISLDIIGFKSFARKTTLTFDTSITAVVGPNGSGKSNVAESLRFALGEQSIKHMRGRRGEDLIWNGSPVLARANRASVKMIFDNTKREFNIDFDEAIVERVVNRDGSNEYILNGSQVRLRDIAELLAHARIGASNHHIISQGEADHVLAANPRERRTMIEDALGLTAYIYKREEAEKKLEKTAINMREVEALRREIAPHLKFLSAQVKKIEEGNKLLTMLTRQYTEYIAREHVYLTFTKKRLEQEREVPEEEKQNIDTQIEVLRRAVERKGKSDDESRHITALERELSSARQKRETSVRELGRVEGEIAALHSLPVTSGDMPRVRVLSFVQQLIARLEDTEHGNPTSLTEAIKSVLYAAREFMVSISSEKEGKSHEKLHVLQTRKEEIEQDLTQARKAEESASQNIRTTRVMMEEEKDTSREAERALFAALQRRNEVESMLGRITNEETLLATDRALFEAQIREAITLVPEAARNFTDFQICDDHGARIPAEDVFAEARNLQHERNRQLERLKIRAEETLGSNVADIEREYRETRERDEFLARELADLSISTEQLRGLISDITTTLRVRFEEGISKINLRFNEFFNLLFGGGEAKLTLVELHNARRLVPENTADDTEDEPQDGVEVSISLSHKRVRGLHMLSG